MGLGNSRTRMVTHKELELVDQSWKTVMENPEENGILFLKTFLDKYNYYSKFKMFEGLPIEEVPGTGKFRKHAISVMETIDQVIMDIDDSTSLKNHLKTLGSSHAKHNVTENEFEEFKEVLTDILENHFQLPEETVFAWRKIFDIAFVYISEGFKTP